MITDRQIESYMDGTLPEAERTILAQRIVDDAALAARVRLFKQIENSAGAALNATAPDSLSASVMHSIVSEVPSGNSGNKALYVYLMVLTVLGIIASFIPTLENNRIPALRQIGDWIEGQLLHLGSALSWISASINQTLNSGSPVLPVAISAVLLIAILDLYLFKPGSHKL